MVRANIGWRPWGAATMEKPSSRSCAGWPILSPNAVRLPFAPANAASPSKTARRHFRRHSTPPDSTPSIGGRSSAATHAQRAHRRSTCRAICRCTAAPSIDTARGSTRRRMATCGIRRSRRAGGRITTGTGRRFARTAGHGSVSTCGRGRPTTTDAGATRAAAGFGFPAARGRPRGSRGRLRPVT